jgi:hypothetical protein
MAKKPRKSSQPEKLTLVSAAAMRKPLTKSQLHEIQTLIQKPDPEIDYSDIPDAIAGVHRGLAQAKNGEGRPVDEVFDELEKAPLR